MSALRLTIILHQRHSTKVLKLNAVGTGRLSSNKSQYGHEHSECFVRKNFVGRFELYGFIDFHVALLLWNFEIRTCYMLFPVSRENQYDRSADLSTFSTEELLYRLHQTHRSCLKKFLPPHLLPFWHRDQQAADRTGQDTLSTALPTP